MKKIFFAIIILISFNFTQGQETTKIDMNIFPKPEKGFQQFYIQLPSFTDEQDYKVELFIGKEILVDCNTYFMLGTIQEQNLESWGYNYYSVASNGETAGTLMGCLDNKKSIKFVHITPQIINYNSKLPIVLYVPEGFKVKYRIFSAGSLEDATCISVKNMNNDGIQFKELEHYFVKNNATLPKNNKINSQKSFDAIFGVAKTMSNIPTSIDFNNEFLIPIVLKETNLATEIQITSITSLQNGTIVINYKIIKGEVLSYNMKPFKGIILGKKYKGKIVLNEEKLLVNKYRF